MVVAYYTSANFIDSFIEVIQGIKEKVTLHVFIEISNHSKNATFINVDSIDEMEFIESPERILGKQQWELFKPYFEGVSSVHFIVQKNKKTFSLKSLSNAIKLGKYIKKLKIDVFHFDTILPRAIGLYPFIKNKQIVVTEHDPIAHSGEESWKKQLPRLIFHKKTNAFVFYSKFAESQFIGHYKNNNAPTFVVPFQPFSFIKNYFQQQNNEGNTILFFGRLSYYKGIDILLNAIPLVLEKYPEEKFVIAGKPSFGYEVDNNVINKFPNNFKVITSFLNNNDLVKLIEESKFVICPYRDATQSGVLMTAFAAKKMVIATNVGSFPEFIINDVNGLLSMPDSKSLAEKIILALDNGYYKTIQNNVKSQSTDENNIEIANQLLLAYQPIK